MHGFLKDFTDNVFNNRNMYGKLLHHTFTNYEGLN